MTLLGGAGDDTLLGAAGNDRLDGGTGTDSLAGGPGDDEYVFAGPTPGADVVNEAANAGKDTLSLLGLTGPVAFSLVAAGAQTVPGGTVTLVNPANAENVIGTPYADTITGNALANVLTGAGGQDTVFGGAGDDLIQAGVTQVVYLDFDTYTVEGKRPYLPADRDAVQARMEADFSPFGYRFMQTRPVGPAYSTVFFNRNPFSIKGVPQSGGIADEVDWRNIKLTGGVSVDVNEFLGYETERITATAANFVALSATIAAHELGHLSGLRHLDSFGPIGSGIYAQTIWRTENPDEVYPGPRGAVDTPLHIMSSPASTRTELIAAVGDAFFGEREAVKLAFFDTGEVTAEVATTHNTRATAQVLPMAGVFVPNTLVATNVVGQTAATQFNAQAANVVGRIDLAAGVSENDFYSFVAQAGDLVTIELLSLTLRRVTNGIDSIVRVYDSTGNLNSVSNLNLVNYYNLPAIGDDNFENRDAVLIDLLLPQSGTYYIEVDTFSPANSDTDTGDYELFVYRSKPAVGSVPISQSGDKLVGGDGVDTLVASSGHDQFFADADGGPIGAVVAPPAQPPVGTPQSGSEVQANGYQLGGFQDATTNGPWTVEVNWGDGSPTTLFPFTGTGVGEVVAGGFVLPNQPHTYVQSGNYPVTVKVTNAASLSSTKTFTVAVANVAPDVVAPTIAQPATVGEFQVIELGSFTDPAVDNPWKVEVDWGDGSAPSVFSQTTAGALSQPHAFVQSGSRTVTVKVTDKDGGTDTQTFAVAVAGTAPTVSLTGDATTPEGSSFQLAVATSASVSAYTIDWGDGTAPQTFARAGNSDLRSHVYADGLASYTISVDVTAGGVTYPAFATRPITVENAAPTVASNLPAVSAVVGTAAQNTGTWADPGLDAVTLSASVGNVTRLLNGTWTWSLATTAVQAAQTVTITATDSDGAVSTTTFMVTVNRIPTTTVVSVSSTASVYGVNSITLSALVSAATGGTGPDGTVRFFDVTTGTPLGTVARVGGTWSLTLTTTALAVGTHSIRAEYLAAGDFDGSESAAVTVTVQPGTPQDLAIAGAGVGREAEGVGLDGSATTSAPGGLQYQWTVRDTLGQSVNLVGVDTTHAHFVFIPMAADTYTITLTVTDSYGQSAFITKTIAVAKAEGVAVRNDPLRPGQTMLVVGGTDGNDSIKINPGSGAAEMKAVLNGVETSFLGVGRIVILAHNGNDDVHVVGGVALPTFISGGAGNDRLRGGGGNNVLVGGAGDDLLVGGAGRDLLIGGFGLDKLVGNAQDDILIAGYTDFDQNSTALDLILKEWTRTDASFATRVNHLEGGAGSLAGSVVLTDQTIHDDGVADVLTGDAGQDWFIFNVDGVLGTTDRATDMTAFEAQFAEDIDFIYAP